jgi:hypothetical protein
MVWDIITENSSSDLSKTGSSFALLNPEAQAMDGFA